MALHIATFGAVPVESNSCIEYKTFALPQVAVLVDIFQVFENPAPAGDTRR